MSAELKPCPFCGGEAEMKDDDYPGYVLCIVCYARGGLSGWQGLGPLGIWNNRPISTAAVQAAVAKAVEAERAECLKLADDQYGEGPNGSYDNGATTDGWNMATQAIATAIRSRGVAG